MVCAVSAQPLPIGSSGDTLDCVLFKQIVGTFYHGLSADLQANTEYTFSFFFRNVDFESPFGQMPPTMGIKMISPNGSGAGGLNMFDPFPNGWYRQRYLFTAPVAGTYQFGLEHSLDHPIGGEYYLYGFQVSTTYTVPDYTPQ